MTIYSPSVGHVHLVLNTTIDEWPPWGRYPFGSRVHTTDKISSKTIFLKQMINLYPFWTKSNRMFEFVNLNVNKNQYGNEKWTKPLFPTHLPNLNPFEGIQNQCWICIWFTLNQWCKVVYCMKVENIMGIQISSLLDKTYLYCIIFKNG